LDSLEGLGIWAEKDPLTLVDPVCLAHHQKTILIRL
jgi:hypothetical protein